MAEATVQSTVEPRSQYFCHTCDVPINPILPEYTCPRCHGGFVELLSPEEDVSSPTERQPSAPTDGTDEQRRVPPPDAQAVPQILEMLQLFMNAAPEEGPDPRQRMSGGATNGGTPGGNQRPNLHLHMPRTSITFQNVGNQPIALMDLFNSLPGMTAAGGGGNFMFPLFNLHGNPQDYVWGEGGLDTIITQLLNNVEGQGPPPAHKDDIDSLRTMKITEDDISGATHECPVCKDDFKVDDEVKKLPCEHIFHPNCVTTWLHMHNTCPVCRRPIGNSETNNTAPSQYYGI